ncbi:hypothetical protein HDV64DRAFT_258631 [Trichoderma sp. TUCIM 5745]
MATSPAIHFPSQLLLYGFNLFLHCWHATPLSYLSNWATKVPAHQLCSSRRCKNALCQAGEGNWVPPHARGPLEAWEKKATPQHSLSSSFPCIKYLHGQGLMHLDTSC